MTITMRATYDTTEWESDEPDTEPTLGGGFTDPNNPWGGFRSETPDGLVGEAFIAWRDENVETVEFEDLDEAAEFVADFPGGVWDFREAEPDQDFRTGVYTRVTLHIEADDETTAALLARVKEIEAARDAHLAALRARS